MTKRRNQRRKNVIPPCELAWVASDKGAWREDEPSKEVIAELHFENRQLKRDCLPTTISKEVRYVEEWPSCLQEVKLMPSQPPLFNSTEAFSGRKMFGVKVSRLLHPKPVSNTDGFKKIVDGLQYRIRALTPDVWVQHAIIWPLGPEGIHQVLKLNFPRRTKLLTFHKHASAFLVVDSQSKSEETMKIIERIVGKSEAEAASVLIAAPNCGYAINIRSGEEPVFVTEASQSKFAIIFEESYNKKLSSAQRYYQNLLECAIVSERQLNDPEKRWLEKQCKQYDLRSRPMRLLEFRTPQDRNNALSRGSLRFLDVLYSDLMQSYTEPFEEVHLYVNYEMAPKHVDCVAVTIKYESDKKFVESSFTSHGLSVRYFGEDKTENPSLRFNIRCKTMVLNDFPRHMRSYDARVWFIQRIAKANCLEIENIEPFTEINSDAAKCHRDAKKRVASRSIEYGLYKIGHIHRLYSPIDAPWIDRLQGGLGAACFFEDIRKRSDVPWFVSRKNKGNIQKTEQFTVHFKNVNTGISLINAVLRKSYKEPIFIVDTADRYGPQLTPCYRRSYAISRRVRVALDSSIRKLDTILRQTFLALSMNEDEIMTLEESAYYGVRLFEEWKNDSETGIIGLQGWNPPALKHFAGQLLSILSPKEVSTESSPELTHSIGEAYVMSLHEFYNKEVVLDVDKFRQVISVIGSRADEAIEDIRSYQKRKSSLIVTTEIPIFFPDYNERLASILTRKALQEMQVALGAKLRYMDYDIPVISFNGTIEAYEMFTEALQKLSTEVFIKELGNRKIGEIPNLHCPICMTESGATNDFYRFHCGHVMCRGCANLMILSYIDDSHLKIKCEAEGCTKFVSATEIMEIIMGCSNRIRELDTNKLRRLNARAKQSLINSDPSMAPCPSADCAGILTKSEGSVDDPKRCQACEHKYCRLCLNEPHSNYTCSQYERLRRPEESIAEYIKSVGHGNIKKCPKCGVHVEKREGCNHIECGCGCHFCWVCLYIAKNCGDCYRHMQEQHGGHGGNYAMPAFEDMDVELQRAILEQVPHQNPNGEELQQEAAQNLDPWGPFYEDIFPEDFDELEEEDLERLNEVPFVLPEEERVANFQAAQRIAWRANNTPVEVRPPSPERPPLLEEFPILLVEIFPVFYGDPERQQEMLAYVNGAQTLEEHHKRIKDLYTIALTSNNVI